MKALWLPLTLLLLTVLGGPSPRRGHPVGLSEGQRHDLRSLIWAGREVEAIREVRRWTGASLLDAVATVRQVKAAGPVPQV